ncbi:MAG: hypothetical protein ACXWUN_07465 [Allosphingosinicella sp.]
MELWKKLQNPYALVGQGFVLGGALFFATHPASLQASSSPSLTPDSVITTVEAGR